MFQASTGPHFSQKGMRTAVAELLLLLSSTSAAAFSAPHGCSIPRAFSASAGGLLRAPGRGAEPLCKATTTRARRPALRSAAAPHMLLTNPPDQVGTFFDVRSGPFAEYLPRSASAADLTRGQIGDLVQASDVEALVISGPSGVGKGSIIQRLLRQLGSRVALCVRSPPPARPTVVPRGSSPWFQPWIAGMCLHGGVTLPCCIPATRLANRGKAKRMVCTTTTGTGRRWHKK